jgi:hypothetical protein
MITILIPLALLIIGWAAFVILARRNESKVQSEWIELLSPSSNRVFQQARQNVEANTTLARVAMNEAMEIRELGDMDEAVRFLNIGADVIQRFTPSLLLLLSLMMKFSRMVSAIAPVSPIVPADFHLTELTSLAHLNKILHRMLTSAKQRFRLKLYIVGKGISITTHYLLKSIQNIVTRRSSDEREWEQILRIEEDFRTLSNESVQSFRTLLEALSSDAAKELSNTICLPSASSN